MSPGHRWTRRARESLTVSDDRISRRDLLRGRVRPPKPKGHDGDIVKPGQSLPDVISWLDPEMQATPRRQSGEDAGEGLFLRPPGAVAEADFVTACTSCGDCAKACPHDAIRSAPTRLRDAEGTPIIDPHTSPCMLCEDLPCIAACETGALRPEAPAALGSARIAPLDCLNRMSSTCSVCVERCPVPGAMTFVDGVPEVNERLCTGCGVCQHVCPAPNNAVLLLPNPDRPSTVALDLEAEAAKEAEASKAIELPDLHEAMLDEAGVRALFGDLAAAATIDEVRCKQGRDRRADPATHSLDAALEALLARQVLGVQIRYRYEGEAWCDTVIATAAGHKVVRMLAPTSPSGLIP